MIPRSWAAAGLFGLVLLVVALPVAGALVGAYLAFGFGPCTIDCRAPRAEPALGVVALLAALGFASLPPLAVRFHHRGDRGRALAVLGLAVLLVAVLGRVAGLV